MKLITAYKKELKLYFPTLIIAGIALIETIIVLMFVIVEGVYGEKAANALGSNNTLIFSLPIFIAYVAQYIFFMLILLVPGITDQRLVSLGLLEPNGSRKLFDAEPLAMIVGLWLFPILALLLNWLVVRYLLQRSPK